MTVKQSVNLLVSACFLDEGALVRAAQNLGFVFSGRTPDSVIVELVRGTGTGTLLDVKIQFMTILLAVEYLSASFINVVFYLKKTEMAE